MNENLILIVFIILISISFILHYIFRNYKSIGIYTDIDTNNIYYIPLYILSIIINFYSRGILFLNLLIFLFVFFKHYLDIKEECDKLESDLSWTKDKNKFLYQ